MHSQLISRRPARKALLAATLLAALAVTAITVLTVGFSQASATSETTVAVQPTEPWTDTGIALSSGQHVTITASGQLNYFGGESVNAVGYKFSQHNCGKFAYQNTPAFTDPGVNCWAMVMRIGTSGPVFPTGNKITLVAPVAGELYLGVNDDFYSDNSGGWTAKIVH